MPMNGQWLPNNVTFEDAVIITSKGQTKTNIIQLRWVVKETIGQAVVNVRGVSKGRKSVVIGD